MAPDTARVVRLPLREALDRGAGWWDGLLLRSPFPSPFMAWAWHRAWAETASPEELAASWVVILERGGCSAVAWAVGTRPLVFRRLRVRGLTWAVGDLGAPDYLDLLGDGDGDLTPLTRAVEDLSWDMISVTNLDQSARADALVQAFTDRGYLVRSFPLWPCPYLHLPASWEAFVAGMGAKRRQAMRGGERKLEKDHVAMLTDYGPDRFEEGWAHLVTLHEARWRGVGMFSRPRLGAQLKLYAAEMLRCGHAWLMTLDVDGAPVAAEFVLPFGDAVFGYQSGRDPAWDSHSVGRVLRLRTIRRAIESGYRRFDFLRGDEMHKDQWSDAARYCHMHVVLRPNLRGRLLGALDSLARLRPTHPPRPSAL